MDGVDGRRSTSKCTRGHDIDGVDQVKTNVDQVKQGRKNSGDKHRDHGGSLVDT